ncbi:MAG: hypothetical protein K0B02_03045 [DPANN group archaeon]|nr:hypothetical protein [DPANN group archaeon]
MTSTFELLRLLEKNYSNIYDWSEDGLIIKLNINNHIIFEIIPDQKYINRSKFVNSYAKACDLNIKHLEMHGTKDFSKYSKNHDLEYFMKQINGTGYGIKSVIQNPKRLPKEIFGVLDVDKLDEPGYLTSEISRLLGLEGNLIYDLEK